MIGARIQPYSDKVYHDATHPSVDRVYELFKEVKAQDVVNVQIRDCFLKHAVEGNFSACMVHRHFDLKPDERNIEKDGKAVASSDLDDIQECSWLFYQGQCYPYEYERVISGETLPTPPAAFVQELGEIVQRHNLGSIVGFQRYTDGVIGLEKTGSSRVSTTVYRPETEPVIANTIPTSFAFFRPQEALVA